uniref:Ig-like domain-containing protein n=1 Tax=Amphimedon queenslandica TaxID=400682 RepID=A0A1X7SLC6_AMPQE
MVDLCFALFCSLSLLVTVSASVNIATPDEDICVGENLQFVCSVNGTVLRWIYNGLIASYSTSGSMNPRPLDIFQAEFISICNGILSSNATVTVSDSIANSLSGTTIFCDDPLSTDASSNYTININIKGKSSGLRAASWHMDVKGQFPPPKPSISKEKKAMKNVFNVAYHCLGLPC